MFEIVTGKPGDGKSHFVVRFRLLRAIECGRRIFTNIDFGDDELDSKGCLIQSTQERLRISISRYLKFSIPANAIELQYERDWWVRALQINDLKGSGLGVPRGSTIIVDEAQMIWPKSGSRFHSQKFFDFLTYHRHLDINLVFITQATTLMDDRVSDCCNEFLQVKNMWFLTTFLQNQSTVYFRQKNQPWVEPHRKTQFRFDQKIFSIYRSGFQPNQRSKRLVPAFMMVPVLGVLLMLVLWYFKGGKTYMFKGSTHISSVKIPFTPPIQSPPTTPPIIEINPSPSPISGALQQLLELERSSVHQKSGGSDELGLPGSPQTIDNSQRVVDFGPSYGTPYPL